MITRKDLIDSLGPLVAHRRSQGLTPAVVDIEDVYDEFSFGKKSLQLRDMTVGHSAHADQTDSALG